MHIFAGETPDFIPENYPIKLFCVTGGCQAMYVKLEEVRPDFYDYWTNIKYVLCPCTGISHLHKEYAEKKGVEFIYLDDKFKTGIGHKSREPQNIPCDLC